MLNFQIWVGCIFFPLRMMGKFVDRIQAPALTSPCLHVGSMVRSPTSHLTPEQREDVLQLIARLNGGKGNMGMSEAASKELKDLDHEEREM